MNEQVVIDGRCLKAGHPDAWRIGVVVTEENPHQYLVLVECKPRGRERKVRRIYCSPTWLLKDNAYLRGRLSEAGLLNGYGAPG